MAQLYVYDNGPLAARVIHRPALRALVSAGHGVVVGCSRGDGYLFADLPVRIVEAPLPSHRSGSLVDLRAWCPTGHVALDVSLRSYRDTRSPQWRSVAKVFDRRLRSAGLAPCCDPEADAPLLRYAGECVLEPSERPGVHLETRRGVDARTWFVFDFERLLALLPDHDFYCTEAPPIDDPRLVDISELDLVQQALVSERCEVIVGASWQPFVTTLTEANRDRPKAVCGHDLHHHETFWDHPGNPLEYLSTMDQLADFLRCQVRARRARPALGACRE